MILSRIRALLRLTRFEISIVSAIGVFAAGILAGDLIFSQLDHILAALIVFTAASGAFAFNDYIDYDIDLQNKRTDRPLPQKLISKNSALTLAILGFVTSQALAMFLKPLPHVFVIIGVPLFFGYSLGLKKVFFLKNIIIGGAYASTIVFASVLLDSVIEPLVFYFAVMGFIVGFAVEVMIDIADVEGDRSIGVQTIPSKLGKSKASIISAGLFTLICVLDPLPFFFLIDTRLYFDPVFLVLIIGPALSYIGLSWILLKNQSRNVIFRLKLSVFFVMQIGSLAYLIGVLI